MHTNRLSSISKVDSLEKMGEFWDSHDFTDFDNAGVPDIEFSIACVALIKLDLLSSVEKQARRRGVKVDTLVNLWLQQKLAKQTQPVVEESGK